MQKASSNKCYWHWSKVYRECLPIEGEIFDGDVERVSGQKRVFFDDAVHPLVFFDNRVSFHSLPLNTPKPGKKNLSERTVFSFQIKTQELPAGAYDEEGGL